VKKVGARVARGKRRWVPGWPGVREGGRLGGQGYVKVGARVARGT